MSKGLLSMISPEQAYSLGPWWAMVRVEVLWWTLGELTTTQTPR